MERRELLAAGAAFAATAVGGCTGCASAPLASLSMERVSDVEIAERTTYRLDAEPGTPRHDLVSATVENESTIVNDTEPPLRSGEPFVFEGSVHELSYEVVESTPATTFAITLDPVESEPDSVETVRYEELPAVDRAKFRERGWDGDDTFLGFGSRLLYRDDEVPASALVPEPERPVVVWDEDTRGRFAVDGSYSSPVQTYRYSSSVVHPSAAEFGREVRREFAFTLDGLSSGERDLVSSAISERQITVAAGESIPDAWWRLADRFRPQPEVRRQREESTTRERTASGRYVVRYEGAVYWTRFHLDRSEVTTTG